MIANWHEKNQMDYQFETVTTLLKKHPSISLQPVQHLHAEQYILHNDNFTYWQLFTKTLQLLGNNHWCEMSSIK